MIHQDKRKESPLNTTRTGSLIPRRLMKILLFDYIMETLKKQYEGRKQVCRKHLYH